jgi:hypothetical protein
MYLYDALSDDVYARVVEKLAEVAREDFGAARTIEDVVSAQRRPTVRRALGRRAA